MLLGCHQGGGAAGRTSDAGGRAGRMSDLAEGTAEARGSASPPSGGAVQTPISPASTPWGRFAAWMTSAETGTHDSRAWQDCRGAAAKFRQRHRQAVVDWSGRSADAGLL